MGIVNNPSQEQLVLQNPFDPAQIQIQDLVGCQFCGRTFLPQRLQIHLKSCPNKKNHFTKTITKHLEKVKCHIW
jgi:hypothetical protein